MKITQNETDEAILGELGERLARARLERNLTQGQLAAQAGVAKSTVERLERGAPGTALQALLRICRALGFLERLDVWLPAVSSPSPVEQLAFRRRLRKRASGKRARPASSVYTPAAEQSMILQKKPLRTWKWGDEK